MHPLSVAALIIDADGAVVHASGLARTPQVKELLRTRLIATAESQSGAGVWVGPTWYPLKAYRCGDTRIALLLEAASRHSDRQAGLREEDPLSRIVGRSRAIETLKDEIRRLAPKDVAVLLIGESGTGKELVARSIHELSRRHHAPYVVVNAAAVPATLFESEFFGYATGAFTGADRRGRRGRLEQAHLGTLFLDEIGDMPTEVQVKLLRVLQDGEFERLGSSARIVSDFRLISATHRDLGELVRSKHFRLDMFYRIGAVSLRLPPLRERKADVPALAESFLHAFALRHGTPPFELRSCAVEHLMAQAWPGNVRQLKHEVEHAAIFADADEITVEHFKRARVAHALEGFESAVPQGEATVKQAIDEVETSMIRDALIRYAGNKRRAAAALGISRGYLYKRLAESSEAS